MSTLQFRTLVHDGHIGAALRKLQQQVLTDIGMGHLSAAETDGDLAAVAVCQELLCIALLDIEVIHVNAGGHPDFLDLHHTLVLAGLFLSLGLLEAELAVIHDLADRGNGIRRDLDQVQALLLCDAQSFQSGHNAQLFTGLRDQSNLLVADFFIDLMSISSDGKAPPNKKIDGTPIRLPYILKKHHEHTTAHNGIFGMLTLSLVLGVRTGTVPALFYQRILTSPEGVVKGYFKIFFTDFHSFLLFHSLPHFSTQQETLLNLQFVHNSPLAFFPGLGYHVISTHKQRVLTLNL